VLIYLNPLKGAIAITVLISIVFVLVGISQIGLALRVRPQQGWQWLVISGLIRTACKRRPDPENSLYALLHTRHNRRHFYSFRRTSLCCYGDRCTRGAALIAESSPTDGSSLKPVLNAVILRQHFNEAHSHHP
jgi:hypothetical protein